MADLARAAGAKVEIRLHLWWMMEERHSWHGPRTPLRVAELATWLRAIGADIVYTSTAVVPEGAMAAWLARIPHVWHIHEILLPGHTAPTLFPLGMTIRLIGWLSRRVVFVSHGARDVCVPKIPSAKACVVANSVPLDSAIARPPRPMARQTLGIADDHLVVTWIGALVPNKRPSLFLDARARMQTGQKVVALLVGEGPSHAALAAQRHALGLSEAECRLVGFRDDVATILSASDIVVSTSVIESFGRVIIEAGVFELPVVATASQGPTEILREGETGFLVPIDDAATLAERLDRLASDPELRRRMGRAAALRVEREFNPLVNVPRLESVLLEALAEAS
jgi:glycosyltransferase involved in cell wall biosynthesis